ncbi:hypothetical protein AcW1_006361 [Taiwanofungus camphoratus]|nr:hypothetical protein AcW2_005126 [Antrodia cinnamomea]KAI0954481.1 hypothetical protein AcW1_006361 [Antrodia cinnamomea]
MRTPDLKVYDVIVRPPQRRTRIIAAASWSYTPTAFSVSSPCLQPLAVMVYTRLEAHYVFPHRSSSAKLILSENEQSRPWSCDHTMTHETWFRPRALSARL